MRISASYFNESFPFPFSNSDGRSTFSTRHRVAIAVLGFMAMVLIPAALFSAPTASRAPESTLPCATIDWRVGEKLNALSDRTDARTRAIVNSTVQQRDIARAQCRTGQIDQAMDIYRVLDRALTRYVQYGTAPALPK